MKKTLAILIILTVTLSLSKGTMSKATAQRVRTTAVFDADTSTRPAAGYYGVGVRSGNVFLVPPTGNTKRLVAANTHFGSSGKFLYTTGTQNYWKTPTLSDIGITGLTTNYLPKWNGSAFQNSLIFDNGTNVGIGTSSPGAKLHIGTSQSGAGTDGLIVSNFDSGYGVGHTSRFFTQSYGNGKGRTLFYAASNTVGTTQGQFDIITENGGNFLMSVGSDATGTNAVGLYSLAGSETIRLNTNGNSFINSGNVGVGTTSPSQKLDVNGNVILSGTSTSISFVRTSGTNIGGVGWHNDYFYLGGHPLYGAGAGNDVRVYAFGDRLHLGNATHGDVATVFENKLGIGTTSPSQKLDVMGYGKFQSGIVGSSSGLTVYGSESSATGMFLNTAGNLGIGTSSPSYKLDVSGNGLLFQNISSTSNDNVGQSFQGGSGAIYYLSSINALRFDTNASEKMRISSSGNIGIGTTTPTSKLQVVGLPVYADNTAATSAGLTAGAFYRTALGILMVVY